VSRIVDFGNGYYDVPAMRCRAPILKRIPAVAAIALAVTVAVTGCRATRERRPLVAPDLAADTAWYVGSALSGPVPGEPSSDPAAFDRVKLEAWALARLPSDLLDPLSSHAPLIAYRGGEYALLSTGQRSEGARYGSGPDAAEALRKALESGSLGPVASVGALEGFVGGGTTIRFVLHERTRDSDGRALDPIEVSSPSIEMRVHRPSDDPSRKQVALVLVSPPAREDAQAGRTNRSNRPVAPSLALAVVEVVLLPPIEGTEAALRCVIVRSPFDAGTAQGLAVVLEMLPAASPDAESVEAHAREWKRWKESVPREKPPSGREEPVPETLETHVELETTLRRLEDPTRRRAALAFLARETGASFAEELCLTAPDALLEKIADRLREESEGLSGEDGTASRRDIGWKVEKVTLLATGEALLAGDDPDFPFEASLIRHFGVLGTRKGLLGSFVLEESETLEGLERLVLHENLDALLDRSPAVRVRAFDWLAGRGMAPPGYDPLASDSERREALDRYIAETREGEPR
jgi:hypothetical protein